MHLAPPAPPDAHPVAPAPRRPVAASALRLSRVIALTLMWTAGVVILGWVLDIRLLKGILPGLISMKLNTALGFALAGAGLVRMTRDRWDRPRRRRQAALGALCAAAVFAIGALTLLEHATGRDIGIDQALIADSREDGDPGAPGRMAPSAAFNFMLIGLALLCLASSRRLFRLDHTVVVCENGREAVAAVEANRPDLVLMDIQMPEMDGFAATIAIRARETALAGSRRLPIVALTAFAMKGDRDRCLAVGMDDYLAKPIRRDQLAGVLARFTGDAPTWPEVVQAPPALDEAAALAYAGDDRLLLNELLGIFLEDCPAHLQAIQDAVAGVDPAALPAAAHTMSGSVRVLGAIATTDLLSRLESLGREGRVEGAAARRRRRARRRRTVASFSS